MNYCNCSKLGKLIKILYALEMFSNVFGSLFSLFSGVPFHETMHLQLLLLRTR